MGRDVITKSSDTRDQGFAARIRALPRSSALAALLALGVGAIGAWEGSAYDFGTLRQIGPAVFPVGLSLMMIAAAAGILAEGLMRGADDAAEPVPSKALAVMAVLAAPLVFALTVGRFGLAPAVFAAVVVAALADRSLRTIEVLALALGLSVACSLVFIVGLNLNLRIIDW